MARHYYRIYIRKEALKFSAAHMTVFPDGTKERLHGHNYRTEVILDQELTQEGEPPKRDFAPQEVSAQQLQKEELQLPPQAAKMIPFQEVKVALRRICQQLDERVLIPTHCPLLTLSPQSTAPSELEFFLCQRRYVLPSDEVALLPTTNITTESLSAYVYAQLLTQLGHGWPKAQGVVRIEVRVDEITGQGASFIWDSRGL